MPLGLGPHHRPQRPYVPQMGQDHELDPTPDGAWCVLWWKASKGSVRTRELLRQPVRQQEVNRKCPGGTGWSDTLYGDTRGKSS